MPTTILTDLFAVIAPVFLLAATGFTWAKSGRAFDTNQLTPIITNIGTPCLILSSLMKTAPDFANLGVMAGAALMAMTAMAVIGFTVLKLAGLPMRAFLPALIFPNNGNMGLPLCMFAFGEKGLALGIAYFVMLPLTQFTLGQAMASGHMSVLKLLKTPVVWAVILSLLLLGTDTQLPRWAANTINLTGQFTLPLMLMALGVSLARLEVRSLGRSLVLSCLRVFGGLALGIAIATVLGLEGVAFGVVVIQTAMPVAVFNYLFAQLYNNHPEEVAGMVVISTVVSFVSLPFILAWVL